MSYILKRFVIFFKVLTCLLISRSQESVLVSAVSYLKGNINTFPCFYLSAHYQKFIILIVNRTAPLASYLDSEWRCKIGIDTTDISLEAHSSAKGPFSTYFWLAKLSGMQKKNGLNLKMKGARYSSLMSGTVHGFSCHLQTVLNYKKVLAEANKTELQKQIN